MRDVLTVGSLFAGIGGIDLGLERTGHFRTVWFCERDKFCQRVLAKHWPDVPCYNDVTDIGSEVERPDVIAAGFPCQPVSVAGQRLAQDDERWLWPHVDRLVRLLRPRVVLLENVPGLLTAGFGDVIGDLAACGYDAEWDCIPAAAVGAPHRRDRVFIVGSPRDVAKDTAGRGWPSPMAHTSGEGPQGRVGSVLARSSGLGGDSDASRSSCPTEHALVAHSDGEGSPRHGRSVETEAAGHLAKGSPICGQGDGDDVADSIGQRQSGQGKLVNSGSPAPPADWQADGTVNGRIAQFWQLEPNVGRVADGVPHRMDRLRSLGNAVVPQVAQYVGSVIADKFGLR